MRHIVANIISHDIIYIYIGQIFFRIKYPSTSSNSLVALAVVQHVHAFTLTKPMPKHMEEEYGGGGNT